MFDLSKLASIKIGLASPEVIKSWSYAEKQKPGSGEVKKSETINYRSQKPEPEGLLLKRYSDLQRVTNVTVESTRRIPTLEQFVINVVLK